MNIGKTIISGTAAASILAAASIAPLANAEVSASVGVASTYLWRGYDLGSGTPAVSGGLEFSAGGLYSGIWGSSGDTTAGTEYDLYIGYGLSFGADDMFSIDLSIWNYNYPRFPNAEPDERSSIDPGELTEVVLSVGMGPVAFTYYDNIAGFSDSFNHGYAYYTLAGEFGAFALTVGMHDYVERDSATHVNFDYAYNDNLVFTLSQFVDGEDEDNLKFVVSYSIPINL